MLYYKTNVHSFKVNKGSLKRGYVFLCAYYSLIYNGYQFSRDQLISTLGIDPQVISEAEKNIKRIFEDIPAYSSMFEEAFCPGIWGILQKSCNGKVLVEEVKKLLAKNGNSKLNLYSIIYYIFNQKYPNRIKVIYNDCEQFVTYDFLNKMCGSFASQTVRRNIEVLKK